MATTVTTSLRSASVTAHTTRLNQAITRLAQRHARLWSIWFSLGAMVGTIILLAAPVLLMWMTSQMAVKVRHSIASPADTASALMKSQHTAATTGDQAEMHESPASLTSVSMVPLVPGVTVPLLHIVFIVLALLVNAVLHELGHAIAAAIARVRILGAGVYATLVFYPGAYVELDTQSLNSQSPSRRLAIYAAGVWHNLVLGGLAWLLLLLLPYLLFPICSLPDGAVVTKVAVDSPLTPDLKPGAVISELDVGCTIHTAQDWNACLAAMKMDWTQSRRGFCLPVAFVNEHHAYTKEQALQTADQGFCCAQEVQSTDESHLCFSKLESNDNYCLRARHSLQLATRSRCQVSDDCPLSYECFLVLDEGPASRLVRIRTSQGVEVLYLGSLDELSGSLDTSFCLPRLFPDLVSPGVSFIQTVLAYLVMMSPALAVLNFIPAFFLDGQFALRALAELTLPYLSPDRRDYCTMLLLVGNTVLLAVFIIVAVIGALIAG